MLIVHPTFRGRANPVLPIPAWISTCCLCLPSVHGVSLVVGINMGLLTMFASTAPPKKTMCLLLGGSSILTLNFCLTLISDCKYDVQTRAISYTQSLRVSLQDSGEPKLLELLFQSAGKTGVHAATTGQDNGLVQT